MDITPIKEPTLIIMAAGMGSRYGGLKQIDPVTDKGEIIMDFSLFDAKRAGFKKVVFVIKEEMEEAFRALMDERVGSKMEVQYAFQKLDDIPEGYEIPELTKYEPIAYTRFDFSKETVHHVKLVCENEIVILYVDDTKALSSRILHSVDGAHIGVFADGCGAEFSNISIRLP